MKRIKNSKGITLVSLIITIIVLLILAIVSIRLVMNVGIIDRSNKGVGKYSDEEIMEQIKLAYSEWQMSRWTGETKTAVDFMDDKLEEILNLGEEELTVEEDLTGVYLVTIKKNGQNKEYMYNSLTGKEEQPLEKWKQNEDGSFSQGNMSLKIGDYVSYDHTKDKNGDEITETTALDKQVKDYEDGWRVFGIEDGKIKLISAKSVGNYNASYPRIDLLNEYASVYGYGKNAISARSINVEDINNITGYNPTKTGNGEVYGKGTIREYGNEVTYYWDGTDRPYYTYNNITGNLTNSDHKFGFRWFEDSKAYVSWKSNTATNIEGGREKITTITADYYQYYMTTLTDNEDDEKKGISKDSDIYRLLVMEGEDYYLASAWNYITTDYINYGLFVQKNGHIGKEFMGYTYSMYYYSSPRNRRS